MLYALLVRGAPVHSAERYLYLNQRNLGIQFLYPAKNFTAAEVEGLPDPNSSKSLSLVKI